MKKLAAAPLCACLLLVLHLSVPAQNGSRDALTNESVIELVKMGLSEPLIIQKIRQSERHFDTSLAGLKQLKANRVSDSLIREMMSSSNGDSAPNVNSASDEKNSGGGDNATVALEPGIYIRENSSWVEINPTQFSGTRTNVLGSAMTYGIMKGKSRAVLRGASANIRTAQRRPEFIFSFSPEYKNSGAMMAGFLAFGATSPGEFVLVKMERKSNTRETIIGEYSVYTGSTTGARDKDVRDFSFEKVRPGVFKVTPKVDLEEGEYCFYFAGTPAGLGLAGGKLFDFSVAAAK